MSIYLKTPPQPTNLLFDLGASFSWVDCTNNYSSSTYHAIPCSSSLCNSLGSHACSNCFGSPGPGCSNGSCALFPENSVTRRSTMANALIDWLSLPHTDGRNPGQLGAIPEFIFSCSKKKSLLKGLVKGVAGVAGLGRSNFSLSAQVSNTLFSPDLFALCLSGSPSAPGVDRTVVTVDLIMQSDDVFWRIFGSNSMVRIESERIDVWCLGFLDGGADTRTAVVIGGHQMEDNLLQFDLDNNRLGFSSSVLAHGTMCANFNFTTNKNLG
ncbi:Eukaryotic aspartyl protease family protein [Abeliophyllum distichum]|uniref:Eukaryotic aspartyl protease family protein n=1 Tax=Abeliophyllum distichum TaxID=126358 RepID=A0ABD1RF68_9LAMI